MFAKKMPKDALFMFAVGGFPFLDLGGSDSVIFLFWGSVQNI
jgi:hypothetical protein